MKGMNGQTDLKAQQAGLLLDKPKVMRDLKSLDGRDRPECHTSDRQINSNLTIAGKYRLHSMASLVAVFGTCRYHGCLNFKKKLPLSESVIIMRQSC